jgi:chemotaxis protein histidine kinase CheA
MIDINDPEMKELITIFCDETERLIVEMKATLDSFESNQNPASLEKFGQIIDRVMGAAQSLGVTEIGKFCEMGKMIGYKASQANNPQLLELAAPILMDAVDIVESMVKLLRRGEKQTKENIPLEAFASRLKWYLEKFKDIERASVAIKK